MVPLKCGVETTLGPRDDMVIIKGCYSSMAGNIPQESSSPPNPTIMCGKSWLTNGLD